MLNETKFTDKGNGFRYALSGGIADTTLLSVATQFKTGVSRKYKTLLARALGSTFEKAGDVLSTVKYDGEGVFVFFDNEKDLTVAFNAPSGRARIGLPCLKKATELLKKAGIKKALLVAESYLKTPVGTRSRVGDVIHITANGTDAERENLALAFYDAIMLDGKDLRENQKDCLKTWKILGDLFGEDPKELVHRVEGKIIPGKEVPKVFEEITATRGLEGAVLRLLNNETIYKVKPSLTIDAVVIGYVEGDFEGKYGVTSLLCGVLAPDGKTLQVLTRVGSGFSDEQREALLEPLATLKVEAPLRMTDSDGRPITFVAPKIVVEVEGEALVETNLAGEQVTSQTLEWDGKAYTFKRISPSARLTHATFARLRDDKVWNDGGTRAEQVFGPEAIKMILTAPKAKTEEHTIRLREVYTKESKGETAVRKIVVVEREAPGANYHKFTLHWTDFSPGRKIPLETKTEVADSTERLDALVAAYQAEAGKKGWSKAA